MHGKFRLLSQGKAIAATVRRYPQPFGVMLGFFLCAVFSCFRHTTGGEAYSFTTNGYRIFNVCRNCRTHEGGGGVWGGGGVRHKQVCTRVDSEGQPKRMELHYVPPEDRTLTHRVFGLNSDAL